MPSFSSPVFDACCLSINIWVTDASGSTIVTTQSVGITTSVSDVRTIQGVSVTSTPKSLCSFSNLFSCIVTKWGFCSKYAEGVTWSFSLSNSFASEIRVSPDFKIVNFQGKIGNVLCLDTERCFHFGSRQATNERLLILIEYGSLLDYKFPKLSRLE